jgi:hypothetical protein
MFEAILLDLLDPLTSVGFVQPEPKWLKNAKNERL